MTRPHQQAASSTQAWRLSASGRLRRLALASVLGAPSLLTAQHVQAGAGFGSPQFFDAARASQQAAPPPGAPGNPSQPTLPNGASSPEGAAARAERSIRSLQQSIQRIDGETARQRAAALARQLQAPAVANGLAPGGLVPAVGALPSNTDGCLNAAQCLWVNAELPTQTVAQGRTNVEVRQTDQKAILTWETFNVGADTTLHIDQRQGTQADGGNDWVALNRVSPGVQPSVVQGAIGAEGAVYVINQNGILFDAGSSVDTHSLVVSTLPIYHPNGAQDLRTSSAADVAFSNRLFLTSGPTSQSAGTAQGSVLGLSQRGGASAELSIASQDLLDEVLPGDIDIAAGARLSVKDEGFALIAAPNVRNDGVIQGSDSQIAIAAGVGVQVQRSSDPGSRFEVDSAGRIVDRSQNNADITPVFNIENSGVIDSRRGGVSLVGTRLVQDGVLQASTSVARQGFIDLRSSDSTVQQERYGLVRFGGDSITAIVPDTDKTQTNSSASADDQFQPLEVAVTGGAIVLERGAMVYAPGHSVDLLAVSEDSSFVASVVDPSEGVAGRVYIAPEATIDVAGLADVLVPLANVLISVPRLGLNELADSPLQRSGVLFRSPIVFDVRDFGVREDGLSFVGTPLANLAGFVENISRGVRELLTNGGSIGLIGNEVIAGVGSALNLAGGYLHYGSGQSNATRLITASGTIVKIADADPNTRYVGFAGRSIEMHPRWNVTETFIDPLLSGGAATVFEPEDIAGGRAGSLTIFGQSTSLIAANIDAHAVSGTRQVGQGRPSLGGELQWGGNFVSQLLPGQNTATSGPSFAIVESLAPSLLAGVSATSDPLERGGDPGDTRDPVWWSPVPASSVRQSGASVLRVIGDLPSALTMGGEVRVVDGAQVSVTPGGNASGDNGVAISGAGIELSASRIAIDGDLTAPAGRITLTTTGRSFLPGSTTEALAGDALIAGDIAVGDGSTLSVRGQFVNDNGLEDGQITGGAYINGGSITLSTLQSSLLTDLGTDPVPPSEENPTGTPGTPPTVVNLTGSILLDAGAKLDAISGARIGPSGRLQRSGDDVVRGRGGSISLGTFVVNGTPFGRNSNLPTPTTLLDGAGRIELGAELLGFGFERGGRLALRAPGIVIDGGSGSDERGFLSLDPALFGNSGFADFRLDAVFDASVLPGIAVNVSQRNFVALSAGDGEPLPLAGFASGSDLAEAFDAGALDIGRLDAFHRRPSGFEMYSGDYLNWVAGENNGALVPPDLSASGVSGTTLVDRGARITADARSTVVLGSHGQVTLFGEVRSRGGDVTLTVDTARGGYLNNPGVIVNPFTSNSKAVFLGAESRIDVSGTTLFDTSSVPAGSQDIPLGDVIGGGSVTLTADTGYVIALNCADSGDCAGSSAPPALPGPVTAAAPGVAPRTFDIPKFGDNSGSSAGNGGGRPDEEPPPLRSALGALIDISGASGRVGLRAPFPGAEQASELSSDAGRLRIGAASGLMFNGFIAAQRGGVGSQGGSLAITPLNTLVAPENGFEGARRLTLSAITAEVPDEFLIPGATLTRAPTRVLDFAVDVLADSGVSSLSLGSDPLLSREPVPIDILTSLDLSLGRELQINTTLLTARPPVPLRGPIRPIEVSLAAPYVAIHGYSADIGVYNDFEEIIAPNLAEIRQPRSFLTVDARVLDIGGQLAIENFRDVAMSGREDIRFLTPPLYGSFASGGSGEFISLPGVLLVGGNLDLSGGRIYPATGHTQILLADNHLRRTDLELLIKPTMKDKDGEPLLTLQTIYEPSTARIRFLGGGGEVAAAKPLSVGGRLIASAVDIEQNGALYAPGGQIQLGIASDQILEGVNDDSQVFNYDLLPYFRAALPTVMLESAFSFEDLASKDPLTTAQTVAYAGPVRTQVGLETITRSVSFGSSSLTSVSLDGLTVPFGRTVDGLNLIYNGTGDPGASIGDLRQAPDKRIGAVGDTVDIRRGATVDLSGGGDLIASEFVAGTGGSRDVLSAAMISFAGGQENLVSQYPDGRDVYAILPGYAGVAPFDPEFTRRDPDGELSGTPIAASESARAPLVGRAVFLSGVPGLAEGVYTLLPGAFATLPGAFRLVQDTRAGAQDAIGPIDNLPLPDGTLAIAGRYVDALSGARSTHSTTFLVQSREVWTQYSQYDFTSLNRYFNEIERAGNRLLRAPADGGALALSVLTKLSMDGDILGAAPAGFSGPELQLSAPRIEITDSGRATSGYLSLDAGRLNALGASRLLIGATTGPTDDGIEEFYVGADTVVIGTSAATPLRAGEIVLVASGDRENGVVVQQDSQLIADGGASGRRSAEISIGGEGTRQRQIRDEDGATVDADEPDPVNVSGDGGFLQVSVNDLNGPGRSVVSGVDVPGVATKGTVTVGAGVLLSAAGSVSLEASSGIIAAPSVDIDTPAFGASTGIVTVSGRDTASGNGGLLVGPGLQQQLADTGQVFLQARDRVNFLGEATLSSLELLTLNTGQLISDAGTATLQSERVVFSNQLGSPGVGAGGLGTLVVDADEIELLGDRSSGNAALGFQGFGELFFNADRALIAVGGGTLDLGDANLFIDTPLFTAASGANVALSNASRVEAAGAQADPILASIEGPGGALSIDAESILWNTVARVSAGSIRFTANGDIRLGGSAALDARGAVFTAYDKRIPLVAGAIALETRQGNLRLDQGSSIDVSAGEAGGDAGRLDLRSNANTVVLDGELVGVRAAGSRGALLSVDSRGAIDLDNLAAIAAQGGFDGAIALRSGSGDLNLSAGRTLTADEVRLVADGGRIGIDGVIDASGAQGGDVALFGQRGVSLTGGLLANAQTASATGGTIAIGVGALDTRATDETFGYRAITADRAGRIDIAGSATIDVRGAGGQLKLRAPVLEDGRVPVTVNSGALIRGAANPELEIFARWDASDRSGGALHFSGAINPAGFVAPLAVEPPPPTEPPAEPPTEPPVTAPPMFDPEAVRQARNDVRFINRTLADYVRAPGWQIDESLGQASAWEHRAGIDLTNDSATVNGGDIRVVSNWNLAAGRMGADGNPELSFRTAGLAPTISLRAAGDVQVGASISDGFFQTLNPFDPPDVTTVVDNSLSPLATAANPLPLATASLLGLNGDKPYDSASIRIVAGADSGSADPLALSARFGPLKGNVVLSGNQTATSIAFGNEALQFVTPTMIRTGIGSIDVIAANDIRITDTRAPGVIYSAGHAGIPGVVRPRQLALQPVVAGQAPVLDTGTVQPRDAGDLNLFAGRDIVSITTVVDTDGSRTGGVGTDLTQFWWPWMQDSCITTVLGCGGAVRDSASINFGMFAQGLLSSGGDVSVDAGRDISALSVSMPTTWNRADGVREDAIGGGNLDVRAGGDIAGGSYFVSSGTGALRTLGVLGGTVIALQDAQIAAEAARGLSVGGVFNPSYLFSNFDSNAYSAESAVRLVTAAGGARVGTAGALPGSAYGGIPGETRGVVQEGAFFVLPAHLSVAAANGALTLNRAGELFPSADGQLELFARDTITLQGRGNSGDRLGLIDAPADLLPSIDNRLVAGNVPASGSYIDGASANFLLRDPDLLHARDTEPVRIYSVAGSLLNGYRATDQVVAADPVGVPEYIPSGNGVRLLLDKPATVRAGLDIINLNFSGQNFYASDVTTIAAGRDLLDPVLLRTRFVPLLELGGPGTFALSAGRNLGPITSAGDARDAGYLFKGSEQFPGIRTVGNTNNLFLDRTGAAISIAYGVGKGVRLEAFAETYINPATNHDPLDSNDALGTPDYSAPLVAFVRQQLTDAQARDGQDRGAQIAALNPASAWEVFRTLAVEQRQNFAGTVFLDILDQVGLDFNAVKRTVTDRNHPMGVEYNADNIRFAGQYGRGYQAIETLFPAELGYTQNALDGSGNGALVSRTTGTLDIRGSTIQTRFGGNIDILGPGGPVLVGSTGAPPFTAETGNTAAVGPSSQGILALQTGSIQLFADQSIQLAQSRVFTQQGGDLLIWSSNGDINAGKGAKTSSEVPPLDFACDDDLFCVVDTQSQVSGAGIAALQTDPTQPPGSANLIAPVGTVDAGDAGIRVTGSLNVAALAVANADNIQVSGVKVGVPTGAVDTAAASVANSVAAAVTASADQAASSQTRRDPELELFVEILTPKGQAECDPAVGGC